MREYRELLFDTATQFGFEKFVLEAAIRVPGIEPYDVRQFVDRGLREFDDSPGSNGVVIIPLFPGFVPNMLILCTIAHAFRTRGYSVILIGCDDEIPVCSRSRDNDGAENSTRAFCQFSSQQVSSAFGFERCSISDFLPIEYAPDLPEVGPETSLTEPIEYGGVDIGQLSLSSVRKYFHAYNIDPEEERVREVYREYLRTAAKLADATKSVIDEGDVVAVIAFDDNYVYGGTPLRVAAGQGIPSYSVDVGYMNRSLLFGNQTNRNSLPLFTDSSTLEDILTEPLSRTERREVSKLIEKRARGEAGRYLYSPQTDLSVDSTDGRRLVAMFTNLSWDASLDVYDTPFSDMFHWIRTTIDLLGGREDVELVVRTHPAEAARGTNEAVAEWIDSNLGECPPNVTVLEADSDVNTYELLSKIDLCIVYASIVGLESVLREIPTVVGGDTHYRNLGITHDPATAAEYIDILENMSELSVSDRSLTRAERYAYFFFFRKHIEFPFFEENAEHEELPFNQITHERIKPGNRNFDQLVEQVINNEPVFTTD